MSDLIRVSSPGVRGDEVTTLWALQIHVTFIRLCNSRPDTSICFTLNRLKGFEKNQGKESLEQMIQHFER